MEHITIRGARTHNLKSVDLTLTRDQFIVITGLSGSGKSSLAFDTLYAEGQRRYVESLSAYARQFLSMMEKPDVDVIEGLSPAISIEQKSTSHNPRSTVGTVTEIYDYLRLLYARVGDPQCPKHHTTLNAQTVTQMVDTVLAFPEGTKCLLLAPVVQARKGEHLQLLAELKTQGFIRARIDGEVIELDDAPTLDLRRKHTIEVVVDRFKAKASLAQRLAESFETALKLTNGLVSVAFMDSKKPDQLFSANYACTQCGYSLEELEPRIFSFNNPKGACEKCDGLGVQQFFDPDKVVQDAELSLAAGAIRGWDRRTMYYYQMLLSLSKHYDFDLETPFQDLPEDIQQIVFYGSEDDIEFRYTSDRGRQFIKTHPFEGILNNFDRRYHETESNMVREDLTKYLTTSSCKVCKGERLRESSRHVFVAEKSLPMITGLSIEKALDFFQHLTLEGKRGEIAAKILKEVCERLSFLVDVGLNYLTINRSADTLSGGEAQRIRLASQIGAGLVGVMYVLDEPSIGLHQRDNERLLKSLKHLRDLGNTVIVVEHDEEAIRTADTIVDIGPGAGVHGGEVIAVGDLKTICNAKRSITGEYLSGKKSIAIPKKRVPIDLKKQLKIRGAAGNNLKKVDVDIPLGVFTCITGVSGSGKSTLINDTLYPAAAIALNRATQLNPAKHRDIKGFAHLDKVIDINQAPIGRTPRSNPATYIGVFTPIRELFAQTPESRTRGYKPGRFSFNVKGGRCEACQGDGVIRVEMHFLPDMHVQCDICKGKRYNRETLDIQYKGKTIHEILAMTVEDARPFFDAVPVIARKLQTLIDVGLSYITLGQNAKTLSGGEAQRVKLAKELSKRDTGRTLYILDEPTTGLHFHDIDKLLTILYHLRDAGNSIVVIEHNTDVIKTADWVIDLGPEGGDGGGEVIATGTPEQVAKQKKSHTGRFLKTYFNN